MARCSVCGGRWSFYTHSASVKRQATVTASINLAQAGRLMPLAVQLAAGYNALLLLCLQDTGIYKQETTILLRQPG